MDGSFGVFDVAASALEAQRTRTAVITRNIANAQVTRTDDGEPYRRRVVRFEQVLDDARGRGLPTGAVRAVTELDRKTPFVVVDAPNHPDAVDGQLRYPNVDLATEMIELMDSTRKYEANLAVLRNWREMLQRTLEINR